MANTLDSFRNGAVGFIEWLDAALQARKNDSKHRHHRSGGENTENKIEPEIWDMSGILAESWWGNGIPMVSSLEYTKHHIVKPELVDRN